MADPLGGGHDRAVAALRWIDSHCHLPEDPEARGALIAEAAAAGVARLITVGCDVAGSRRYQRIAHDHTEVFATAGVHPHDAKTVVDEATGGVDLSGLAALLDDPKVVAVGECGLDFYYDHSPREQQRDVFVAQIALAKAHDRALVIHTRDAWPETFAILESEGVPDRTVFHCFTGGPDEARWALDHGIRLSFSGIVTFPSAPDVRAAAELCPLDMLLIETDSPYLAPVPHRGRKNRPALVTVVGAAIAAVKGMPVEVVAAATWDGAQRLYLLP
jgi:TatD DNase family protein